MSLDSERIKAGRGFVGSIIKDIFICREYISLYSSIKGGFFNGEGTGARE